MTARGMAYLLPPEKTGNPVAGGTGSSTGSSIPIQINASQSAVAGSGTTPITVNTGSNAGPGAHDASSSSGGSMPRPNTSDQQTSGYAPQAPTIPQVQWVVTCSRCFRELPAGTAPGTPCPYCNPADSDSQNAASGIRLSGRGVRGLVKLFIGLVAAAVSAVIYQSTRRD